jgi:hypothetical protein
MDIDQPANWHSFSWCNVPLRRYLVKISTRGRDRTRPGRLATMTELDHGDESKTSENFGEGFRGHDGDGLTVSTGKCAGSEVERVPSANRCALQRWQHHFRREETLALHSIRQPAVGAGHDVVGSIIAPRAPRIVKPATTVEVKSGMARMHPDACERAEVIFGRRPHVRCTEAA